MPDELNDLSDAEFLDLLLTRIEARGEDTTSMRRTIATVSALETGDPTPLPGALRRPDQTPTLVDLAPVSHVEGVPDPEDIEDLISPDKPVGTRTLRRWHREQERATRYQWAAIVFVLIASPWLSVLIFRTFPW